MDSLEWRTLSRCEDYEISEYGDLRRIALASNGRRCSGKSCVGGIDKDGYRHFTYTHNGKLKTARAHVLVCETFHGPRPTPRHVAAHYDGNNRNNHFSNLRWATHAENMADKVRHGRSNRGEKSPMARLSDKDALSIKRRLTGARGEVNALAREYGVTPNLIYKIRAGDTWRHINERGAA